MGAVRAPLPSAQVSQLVPDQHSALAVGAGKVFSESTPKMGTMWWKEVGDGRRGAEVPAWHGEAGVLLLLRLHWEFCNLQLNCSIQKYFWQMVFHNHSSLPCTISFA